MWGTQESQKKEAFGEYQTGAEEELARFKKEEEYVMSLITAFDSLKKAFEQLIAYSRESFENMNNMATSFLKVKDLNCGSTISDELKGAIT